MITRMDDKISRLMLYACEFRKLRRKCKIPRGLIKGFCKDISLCGNCELETEFEKELLI